MKRIYASLALLLVVATGAFAQRHCDVAVLPLIGPDSNSVYPCTDSVLSGYYMVNLGPDTIKSYDSFDIRDPNIDNYTAGADPTDESTFRVYRAYPTGLVLNGYIDTNRAPTMDIAPGDTILYYKWNDYVTRLCTLINADTPLVILPSGDTVLNYVFTPTGSIPPNGNYYWRAHFLGFDNIEVVDTNSANNNRFSLISLSCATGIHDANFNKVGFTVYPNPTNSTIFFNHTFTKAESITARVMDLTGKTLKTVNLGKAMPGTQKFEINVNNLPSGTYLLEFTTGDTKGIAKFTKDYGLFRR